MSVLVIHSSLCEFWWIVSVQESVHFISAVKHVGTELYIALLYCPFSVHGISSNVPFLISHISNLCLFFLA